MGAIFTKIRRDIRNFVIIAGVIDTGDELLNSGNDTSDILSPLSLLPAINYRGVIVTGD
jgi:hypothetical protein